MPFIVPVTGFPGVTTGFAVQGENFLLISDEICLYLRQEHFWEPDDYFLGFESLPPVQVAIDNQEIRQFRRFLRGVLEFEVDENGNEIGSHGDTMDYCFSPTVEVGQHIIEVEVTTTSGIVHSYSWQFIITPL
jgi:hypothetical protein